MKKITFFSLATFLVLLFSTTVGYGQVAPFTFDGSYCPNPGSATSTALNDEYFGGFSTGVFEVSTDKKINTCKVEKIWAKVDTQDNSIRLGIKNGNNGQALFRIYLDTDNDPGSGLLTETGFNGVSLVAGAEFIIQIAANGGAVTLYEATSSNSYSLVTSALGLNALEGNSDSCTISGDGRFMEFYIPFGDIGFEICNENSHGIIKIARIASVAGNATNSSNCVNIELNFGINLTGTVNSQTICYEGDIAPLHLNIDGDITVMAWQYSTIDNNINYSDIEDTLNVDSPDYQPIYPALPLTVGKHYYRARIRDANGSCPDNDFFSSPGIITVNALPDAPIVLTPSDATCEAPGTARISNYSATVTYTFDPTGPSVGALGVITGLTDGQAYTVTATSASPESCESAASAPFTIDAQPATPTLALDGTPSDPTTCSGSDGSIALTLTNVADGDYEFFYGATSFGTFTVTGGATTITGLSAGVYNDISITVAGCTSAEDVDVTLTDPATPAAPAFTQVDPTCLVATGSVSVTSPVEGSTYTLTGITPVVGAQTGTSFASLAAGTYELTETNAVECISSATPITIAAQLAKPDAPTAGTVTQPTCSVSTGSFTISNYDVNYTYTFSPSAEVVNNAGAVTAPAGSYTVTATSGICTSDATPFTIDAQPAAPVANAGANAELNCTYITLVLNGSVNSENQEGFSYSWSGPGNFTSSSARPTIDLPGTYTLTVTNDAGCSASDSVIITQDITKPTVTLVSSATELTCTRTSITLSATGTVQGTASYLWSKDNNLIEGATTAILTVTEPGEYLVVVKDSDNGCYEGKKMVITQNISQPELTIGSDTTILTCTTESIALTATATVQGTASYLWSTGATTATIEVTASGEYSVTVTDSNSGCSAMGTVTVTENISETEATITGNAVLTCLTESITLDASGTSVQGTPGYVWNTGATTATIVVTAPGEYSVIVTGSDNGCSATATTTVTQNVTPPVVNISGNEALTCSVTSITLDASGTSVQGMATYLWNTGETTPSIVVDQAEDYTVAVTDSNNGCSSALTITVTENYDAEEVAGGSVALCITDASLDLTTLLGSDFVSGGTWTGDINNGGFNGNTLNPLEVNLGDYEFIYTEPGDCGHIITIAVSVNDDCVVLACSTEDMIISKVVTPNNDSYNDNFEITGLDGCDFTFGVKIFNRWGKIVYQSENYQNNWNGRNDGSGIQIGSNSELSTGTYYYILTVSGGTGFKPMTGYIYLGTH